MSALHPAGNTDTRSGTLPSLLNEADRLRAYTPPFRFSAFFSPEDTLLCMRASEDALARLDSVRPRVAELTTGSGLVGLHILRAHAGSDLIALDIDPAAISVASQNAGHLGLSNRAQFECADLWSAATIESLRAYAPDLLICNPPYIPEPPGEKLEIEAGAGLDGTAHLIRTLELAGELRPQALSLSWCSLSDPAKVLRHASHAGYVLDSLFIAAIADGEYSGSVRGYLQSLPQAYMNEQDETLDAIAPDGSASFCYLLMAGSFSRNSGSDRESADVVESICNRFESQGLGSLTDIDAPFRAQAFILNRMDELALRVILHGDVATTTASR